MEELITLKENMAKLNKEGTARVKLESDGLKCKVHCHRLEKLTLTQLIALSSAYKDGFGCDGRNFTGCKSGMTPESIEYRIDPEETMYHCSKTNTDYCQKCGEHYSNKASTYPLKLVTFKQLQKLP